MIPALNSIQARFSARHWISRPNTSEPISIVSSDLLSPCILSDQGLPHHSTYQALMENIQDRTGVNPHNTQGRRTAPQAVKDVIHAIRGTFANPEAKVNTANQLGKIQQRFEAMIDQKLPYEDPGQVGC